MPVTADQVATLRAYLAGDFHGYERLHGRLDHSRGEEFSLLLTSAFYEAVHRRFGKGTTASDVIEFVGNARTRYEGLTDQLDPRAAERLIRAMLTDEDVDDLDATTGINTQLYLLYVLVADEHLDDAGLDAFMAEARAYADEALA